MKGLKLFVVLYAGVVVVALLAAIGFTNLYLTKALFTQIQKPLDTLVKGVQRIRDGDLESPIAYPEADEFRPACDAVDEMVARLQESLTEQQKQQKKQELIAGMSHDLKTPLTVIRAYTEALLAQYARLKPSVAVPQTVTVGPLTAEPAARRITQNGREISLKNKEYELIFFLMRHPEHVFSREDLYELIWGLESMGDNITVAVHINRLREKSKMFQRNLNCCKLSGA